MIALIACNKEIVDPTNAVEEPEAIEAEPILLTFSSERPQTEAETKTAWDNVNSAIVWTTGDRIRVGYTLDGKWMSSAGPADFTSEPKIPAKFFVSNNVSIDAEHANSGTFTVPTSYTNAPSGSAIFYGIYPSSSTSTDSNFAPSLTVDIPTSQTPGANTFAAAADIMVGKTEATTLSGTFPTDPLALEWDRVVAHADITFKNLAVAGDASVNKITLVFNSEAKVVGTIYLDVTNGAVTTTGSSSNQIEILGDNLAINEGKIEAWAAVLPVTFTSVDVTVKTDLATYTRSITGISKTFKKNARNTLGINMATATRTLNTVVIPDGNYVIAAKSGDKYYAISSAANGTGTTTRRDRSEITTEGFAPSNYSAVSPYSAANNIIWTITNVTGGVKINLAGDTNSYMQFNNDNKLPLGNTGSIFEVTENTGTYTFTNSSKYIAMNGTNGFACYSSSTGIHDLYVIPATGTPTLTFAETSKNVAADVTSVSFSYTSSFLASDPNVAVTSDAGNAVSSTSIADGTLTVNLNANSTSSPKTVTLTVSATGVSDVVITITQAGVVPDAENGDVLWAEAFTGFSNNDVPSSSNASTTVYGSGIVTYSVGNGSNSGTTKIYGSDNNAGGVAPELLIAKASGYLTATNIPTGNATAMTLTFKSNNSNVVVTSTTEGKTINYIGNSGNTYTYSVTVPSATKALNLTFTNNAGNSTNIRIDDITLVAGAPVPGITVITNAASSTTSAEGTTATLNGELSLVNGAVNGSVTEAGFYYKLTSAGGYTKVTCASAPTSTTSFSYDLTSLTKDLEYTFYAYAIYDSGSEVTGDPLTFTPTQSGGETELTITWGTDITSNSGTVGDISFSVDKGNASNAPAYNSSDKGMRVYQGSNFTFTCSSGNIKSIVFTVTGAYTGTNMTASPGSYNTETKTWTGDASSVTIYNDKDKTGTNTQFRFTKVVIIYE